MLRIAICDDDEFDLNAVKQTLIDIQIKSNVEFSTSYFYCGEELCEDVKVNTYDIIILDIIMCGIDGIETAREIRRMGENSKIIFISSFDDRLRELFKVDTIAFIDKPVNIIDLSEAITRVYNEILDDENNQFSYESNNNTFYIPFKNILYIESISHHNCIKTVKETIKYYGNLKSAWGDCKDNIAFAIPHKSFIINFKYANVTKTNIRIIGEDITIPIGRVYKEEFLDRYTIYMKERCNYL